MNNDILLPLPNRHVRRAAKHHRLARRRPSPPSPQPVLSMPPVLVESPKARARREARERSAPPESSTN